jgi:hypothetical protein
VVSEKLLKRTISDDPFLVLHKENDNVLYLCTEWNKNCCASGETTTPSLQTATQMKIIYQ